MIVWWMVGGKADENIKCLNLSNSVDDVVF